MPSVVAARFDTARFQPEEFLSAGIRPPPSIVRSVSRRQAEYLAGRLCAREALRAATGVIAVPALGDDRAPQWPAGHVGSITHCHGWAAAIAGSTQRYAALGLDAENIIGDDQARELAPTILTPAEASRFASELARAPGFLITLIFSLKESLFKALNPLTGRPFYFQDAELLDWHPGGRARFRLLLELSEAWRQDQQVQARFACLERRILSLVAIPGTTIRGRGHQMPIIEND